MTSPRGEHLRNVHRRVAQHVADETTLKARSASSPTRIGGCLVALDDHSLWVFDATSAAAASPTVLVPDAGSGRWHNLVPAGGSAGGTSYKIPVRLATAGALPAYARVGNVITGAAPGALGNVDGVAVVAGDRLLLTSDGTASDVDNGIYVATSIGGATAYVLTRADDANADGEIVGGMIVPVQAGSSYASELFIVTNSTAIVVNTTAITLTQLPSYADLASTATGQGASLVGLEDAAARFAGANVEAALADIGARIALAFADTTAQTAYPATARADRQLAVVDDDDAGAHADGSIWVFDAASAAGASDYVRVPDAGAGRWLRLLPTLAELAAVTAGLGASLIGLEDSAGILTATTVETGVAENAANLDVHRPGVPMINRIVMLGAPGAIAAGDTVTIGADVFEFNAATPPAGGTAGRIWVYQGADSAASRANFINAVNGVIDPPNITYDGPVIESMAASAGTLLGTVDVLSADSAGGAVAPSGTATATTETLTTATDVWDNPTMYAGQAQGSTQVQMTAVTITAAMIAQGTLEIEYDFTPTSVIIVCRAAVSAEPYTIAGDRVVLTLSGGGPPAYQVGDVIDVLAQG